MLEQVAKTYNDLSKIIVVAEKTISAAKKKTENAGRTFGETQKMEFGFGGGHQT